MPSHLYQTPLSDNVTLIPVEDDAAHEIGHALANMDPWAHYNYPAQRLIDFLTWSDPSTRQYTVLWDGEIAGVTAVRNPWLHGPYLQLLGVMPDYQNHGIGTLVLNWMENEARGSSRNLWVCASEFNKRAIAFYERHGFQQTAVLDDLVKAGLNEILLRKKIY